jgi:hypothetical protein
MNFFEQLLVGFIAKIKHPVSEYMSNTASKKVLIMQLAKPRLSENRKFALFN